jgi:sugar lactone lactonase YvrE
MNPRSTSTLARRGAVLVSVALLAMAGLAGAPMAGNEAFPAFIDMYADTPSGVTVDKPGNVYVSVRELSGRNVIWKYTPEGAASFYANMGSNGVVYGLAVTPNGDLYVAMVVPGTDHGVYRVDRKGNAQLLPGSEKIVFPNGFAFDERGNLYVTESFSLVPGGYGEGGVWRIPRDGAAELWVQDAALTGVAVPGSSLPPVGANGIAYHRGDLFVTNTDQGRVVRIPVADDGSAGPVELWKQLEDVPESPLAGSAFPLKPDGLALDVHGNLYTTILTRNAVVRLMAGDKTQETVAVLGSTGEAPSALLDFPASLAFGTGAGEQQNLFVTNLGWMVRYFPGKEWPGTAVVKVRAGMPGRPL